MTGSTKALLAIWATETFTAGSTHADSDVKTVDADYGGILYMKITNAATGPTIQLGLTIQASPDNSTWYDVAGPWIPDVANAGVYHTNYEFPPGTLYLKIIPFQNNTGQNVTVDAQIGHLTEI